MSVPSTLSQTNIQQARLLLQRGQSLRAIGNLSSAIVSEPDNAEAYELLGIAYAMADHRIEARHSFEEAINRNPKSASVHYNYALFLSAIEELDDAAEENTTALYLLPCHSGALSLRDQLAQKMRARAYSSAAYAVTGRTARRSSAAVA